MQMVCFLVPRRVERIKMVGKVSIMPDVSLACIALLK